MLRRILRRPTFRGFRPVSVLRSIPQARLIYLDRDSEGSIGEFQTIEETPRALIGFVSKGQERLPALKMLGPTRVEWIVSNGNKVIASFLGIGFLPILNGLPCHSHTFEDAVTIMFNFWMMGMVGSFLRLKLRIGYIRSLYPKTPEGVRVIEEITGALEM